ncbi:hypothetical protein JG687_00012033 [Phytophthora cactorum]|uniref:Uncharacterized protein n=1 Tax=Phytophthora cactorum TaxID=29920 RepID=A0A8T1U468_9STRA|nr:hypothetical protein GQ600_9932 [Phytophthora cactorum]KAG6954051.1 hypothetical protein JG687_00012033 [Phytophthora cactorum]
MSRELVELVLKLPHESTIGSEYHAGLKEHDGKYLPLIKTKFPMRSKAAMISAVKTVEWSERASF